MKHSLRIRVLPFAIAALFAASGTLAQNTSSSLSGHVLDASGKPVAGATVQIVHMPSGTTRVVTTDASGAYSAQGLRVGGPYDITVLENGQKESERDNVYLQLAQTSTVDLALAAPVAVQATNLAAVNVTASALSPTFQPDNKGISTNISQRELKVIPVPNRSIQDIARLDPFVTLINNNSAGGFSQISALGQNNRYNNVTIDAVPTNDSFGLNANGLPSQNQPLSFDAIDEYNISTANYDVTSKRALGASINIVTKSGTNDYHGSVYYAYTNAKDLTGDGKSDTTFTGYSQKYTEGVTLGGPIIKDKLFFFADLEKQKTAAPAPSYGPIGSNAANIVPVTQDQINQIISIAQGYGINAGSLSADSVNQTDARALIKLDWNINDSHRLSMRVNQDDGQTPVIQGNSVSSRPSLGLSSYWYTQHQDLRQYVLNAYDDWSDKFSTEESVSYAKYHSTPTVLAAAPMIQVYTDPTSPGSLTGPSVYLGEDQYRDYNVLNVDTLNGFFAGTWFLGDHTIKAGADFQQDKFYNLFGRTEFGSYQFSGIPAFQSGAYSNYQLYQPVNGDINSIAANWTLQQWGLFVQDTWQIGPLSLQYGLRYDDPKVNRAPVYNACFSSNPIPNGTGPAGCKFGGFGIQNNATISGNGVIEPRLSFNYAFDTKYKTQLRGGIGVSEAVVPGVWLSNPYTNNGVTLTSATSKSGQFNPNPYTQQLPKGTPPTPEVDVTDPDFKLPTALKASLGFDRELPWGFLFSADYIHLQTQNGLFYENLNYGTPTGTMPDGRTSYWNPTATTICNNGKTGKPYTIAGCLQNPNFYNVVYLTNTNQGSADYLSLMFSKPFNNNLFGKFGIVLGHATEVNPATSSQAASNLNNNAVFNGNENIATRSIYSVPKRVIASLTWQHKFFGDYNTSVSAFYDGHSGTPYSWVFGNDASGLCFGSSTNCPYELVYIPSPGSVEFTSATTAAQQQQFWNFINSNSYLRSHQGQVASRNGALSPWVNTLNVSFQQEVPGFFKGNKGVVRFDVYNFLNLLNKKWGDVYDIDFPYTRTLANFAGVDPVTGKYIYSLPTTGGNYSPGSLKLEDQWAQSRWAVQVTLRYTF